MGVTESIVSFTFLVPAVPSKAAEEMSTAVELSNVVTVGEVIRSDKSEGEIIVELSAVVELFPLCTPLYGFHRNR